MAQGDRQTPRSTHACLHEGQLGRMEADITHITTRLDELKTNLERWRAEIASDTLSGALIDRMIKNTEKLISAVHAEAATLQQKESELSGTVQQNMKKLMQMQQQEENEQHALTSLDNRIIALELQANEFITRYDRLAFLQRVIWKVVLGFIGLIMFIMNFQQFVAFFKKLFS